MADNLMFPFSGRVILDANGDPVAGAKLEIFDAGTEVQQTIYTDAALTTPAANPIVANSNGVVPLRFLGTADWKVTFKNASDATLSNYDTLDNVSGAVDTSSFLTGTVAPSRASISKTGTYTTVNATDNGKQINCDATGGDFTVTLDSATVGDGKDYVIKNVGESGKVTVARGGDNPVIGPLSSMTFRSDGATWQIVEAYNATSSVVSIAYAASVTPDLFYATGTNYEIGVLTGAITINNPTSVRPGTFGSFTVTQDGVGSRAVTFGSNFKGSIDFDQAANGVTVFGFYARSATDIDVWPLKGESQLSYLACVVRDVKTSGTSGGTPANNTQFNTADLNTLSSDNDGRAVTDLTSNVITLAAGTYRMRARKVFINCGVSVIRMYNQTTAAEIARTSVTNSTGGANAGSEVSLVTDKFTIASPTEVRLEYRVGSATAGGLGIAASFQENIYAEVEVWRYI